MNAEIIEEHKIWKVNAPIMYNLAQFDVLDWPSLTLQWLPFEEKKDDHTVYKMLLGTHAHEEENKLIVADYIIEKNDIDDSKLNTDSSENKIQFPLNGKFHIKELMDHKGDVNRARYMPQNPSIIATRSSENESFIYKNNSCVLTLKGHTDEGYGVSWNAQNEGRLLTCSFDKTIRSWDINQSTAGTINPIRTSQGHSDKVEDVSWNPKECHLFGSVGDDGRLMIWDERVEGGPSLFTVAHNGDANSLSWHPVTSHLLLTGGNDGLVNLWDYRNMERPLHLFETEANVYRVAWSPLQETLFLSAGLQRMVHIWDIDKIGDDVLSYEEMDKFPSELVIIHSGHTDAVTDLDWHPFLKSTVASVAENNILNVWQFNSIMQDY